MKKYKIITLTSLLAVGAFTTPSVLSATDFEGKENEYIELCKSSTLSPAQQDECREFNTYLKEKNETLKETSDTAKADAAASKASIETIESEIETLQTQITEKEDEVSYLETSITNLKTSIAKKEEEIKERMYSMQTYMNTDMYLEFIFNATNFTDLLSRVESVNELTSYDKDLITSLNTEKEDLAQQKETIATAKENLAVQQTERSALQEEYLASYNKQNEEAISAELAAMEAAENSEEIDSNLAALAAASNASKVEGITQAEPPVSQPDPSPADDNTNTDQTPDPNPTPDPTPNPTPPADGKLGTAIANTALTKVGCPYVWGATGPNSFDCSGLVIWAFGQHGYNWGRPVSQTMAGMGTPVAYNDMQAGDIITFNTGGYATHVGIYIGGGKMVHAPAPGSNVEVSDLSYPYWQSTYCNSRRIH